MYAYTLESASLREALVLRLYQSKTPPEKPQREFAAMATLRAACYPVPNPYLLESYGAALGRPFIVMERILGHSLEQNFQAGDAAQQAEIHRLHAQLMATLHALAPESILPSSPLLKSKDLFASFDTELAGLYKQFKRLDADRWPSVVECLRWIINRRELASTERLVVIHGDLHRNNILLQHSGAGPMVIDWSNIRLGDYRFDLGWARLIGILIQRLSGLPDTNTILALETYAQFSGQHTKHIELFEVIGCLRILLDALFLPSTGPEKQVMADILRERTGLSWNELEE